MARSPVLSFLLFGALVLLGKRSMESFVGSPATQRRSVVARRAEEEEEPEKVAAPGDRLKLKAMGNGMDLEMELFKLWTCSVFFWFRPMSVSFLFFSEENHKRLNMSHV